jgi:hypothetical protein
LGRGGAVRKTDGGMLGSVATVEVDANDDARLLVSAVTWLVEAEGFAMVDVACDCIRELLPEIIR